MNLRWRILLAIIGAPFAAVLLEVGVRLAVPQRVNDIPYEDIFINRYSRALGREVKALAPGMVRSLNGKEVRINRGGNRDYEYPREKPDGVRRIAVIGSSETFGVQLALQDTFAKRLETRLKVVAGGGRTEVLAFGQPGLMSKEVYAYIVDEVLGYGPDVIVYSFVQINYDAVGPGQLLGKPETAPAAARTASPSAFVLVRRYVSRLKEREPLRTIRRNSHLYLFTANAVASLLKELSPQEREKARHIEALYPGTESFQKKVRNTEQWISLMASACRERGVRFAVMPLPYEMELSRTGMDKWRARGIRVPDDALKMKCVSYMKEFCTREKIDLVDCTEGLRVRSERGEEIYIPGDYAHYNRTGNAVIADALLRFVQPRAEE